MNALNEYTTIFDVADDYFKKNGLNAVALLNHIRDFEKPDLWCFYLVRYTEEILPDDIFGDMIAFQTTGKIRNRDDDLRKDNLPYVYDLFQEVRKEKLELIEYVITCFIPLKKYIKNEFDSLVDFYNSQVKDINFAFVLEDRDLQ